MEAARPSLLLREGLSRTLTSGSGNVGMRRPCTSGRTSSCGSRGKHAFDLRHVEDPLSARDDARESASVGLPAKPHDGNSQPTRERTQSSDR